MPLNLSDSVLEKEKSKIVRKGPRTKIGIIICLFLRNRHSIIGLVVKFPLAMREPRVRFDTMLRFLTIIPNDAIVFCSDLKMQEKLFSFRLRFQIDNQPDVVTTSI